MIHQPHGFRPHASGLLVPEDISRKREVWTKAERKLHDKFLALFKSRGVDLLMRCGNPDCDDRAIKITRNNAGESILQCGCKDRVFTSAF